MSDFPTLRQMVKGMKIITPMRAKYEDSWDLRIMLRYMVYKLSALEITKEVIRAKLILLLRIHCLRRSGDVANIITGTLNLKEGYFRQFGSKSDRLARSWTAPIRWSNHKTMDPLNLSATFEKYLELFDITINPDDRTPLIRRLHNNLPIVKQTISKICLKQMHLAGVDKKYAAHSLRMAAATYFIDRGVSVETVMKVGSWSSHEVFMKFYNRAREAHKVSEHMTLDGDGRRQEDFEIRFMAGTNQEEIVENLEEDTSGSE